MNLLETMAFLIENHGLETCEEALAEAWFAKCAHGQHSERLPASIKLDARSSDSGILKLLEHSVGVDIWLEIKGIANSSDARHLKRILNSFHQRRVLWGRKYCNSETEEERSRRSILTVSGYDEHVKDILGDRSMDLFREIKITRSEEMGASDITARLIPDPLINQVASLVDRGNIEFLGFTRCWMSVYQAEILQHILFDVALRDLVLWEVQFTDPSRCLTRLAEGFEKCSGLRNLEWQEISSANDPLTLEHRCRLVRAMSRVPDLRSIRIRLNLGSDHIALAVSDLIRSDCGLESLDVSFEADDSIVEGETEEELDNHVRVVGTRLHSLWPSLLRNTKLRRLRIEVDGSLFRYPGPPSAVVRSALDLAFSTNNTLSEIHISDTYRQCSFPFLPFLQDIPVLSPEERVLCKVRVLKECFFTVDVNSLAYLVNRLPYLYDIGFSPSDVRDRRKLLVASNGTNSRVVKEWDEIVFQLEKNKVGMTLFHKFVLPTVPDGLWAVVLAKASSAPQFPQSGIYCMIQELVQSGIVPQQHVPS